MLSSWKDHKNDHEVVIRNLDQHREALFAADIKSDLVFGDLR